MIVVGRAHRFAAARRFPSRERSGCSAKFRRLLHYMAQDGLENAVHVLEDVAVPESHNRETLLLQEASSASVLCQSLAVVSAIELNHQHPFTAKKIADVRPNGDLPAELEATELPSTQMIPQTSLGVCRIVAQLLSVLGWTLS